MRVRSNINVYAYHGFTTFIQRPIIEMLELWVTAQVTTKSTASECGSEETTDSPHIYVFAFDEIIRL